MDDAVDDLVRPVFESAIVLASQYTKKCNRDSVTATDLEYALKFCARNILGKHMGTMYPEIYEDGDDADEEDFDVFDTDEEVQFSRYSGEDELMNKVNDCWDTWGEWEPTNPIETHLKCAIDNIK